MRSLGTPRGGIHPPRGVGQPVGEVLSRSGAFGIAPQTELRGGEIALAVLKWLVRDRGLEFKEARRKLGRIAKDTGLPLDELAVFVEQLVHEVIDKALHPTSSTEKPQQG